MAAAGLIPAAGQRRACCAKLAAAVHLHMSCKHGLAGIAERPYKRIMALKISDIKLPSFSFLKGKKHCYVRTYHNVWQPSKTNPAKMQAVKTNVRNVGIIKDPDGIGEIEFYEDFINEHPELMLDQIVVSRTIRDGQSRSVLQIKARSEIKVSTEIKTGAGRELNQPVNPVRHAKVKGCGLHLLISSLLKSDPLLVSMQECFPCSWEEIMALAEFLVSDLDGRLEDFDYFCRNHETFCECDLTATDAAGLIKAINEADIRRFFRTYLYKLKQEGLCCRGHIFVLDSASGSPCSCSLNDSLSGAGADSAAACGRTEQDDQNDLSGKCSRQGNGGQQEQHGKRGMQEQQQQGRTNKISKDELGPAGLDTAGLAQDEQVYMNAPEKADLLQDDHQHDDQLNDLLPDLRVLMLLDEKSSRPLYYKCFSGVIPDLTAVLTECADALQCAPEDFVLVSDLGSCACSGEGGRGCSVIHSSSDDSSGGDCRACEMTAQAFRSLMDRMILGSPMLSSARALEGKCFLEFIALSIFMLMEHVVDAKREAGDVRYGISMSAIIKELMSLKRITLDGEREMFTEATRELQEILGLFCLSVPGQTMPDHASRRD